MKIVVIGDLHNTHEEPKHSQAVEFMKWFVNSEYNIADSILISLGDQSETAIPYASTNDEIHDFYERRCLARSKRILTGNHDMGMKGYFYQYLNSSDIKIIDMVSTEKIDNLNILYLPHYDYMVKKCKPMYEYYSALPEEISSQSFDLCFSHIMDETTVKIEKSYCDLSYLKINTRVFGHNHKFDMDTGGSYLGAVTLNSSSEKGRQPYICVIDSITKEIEYVKIPKTLEFHTVEYPSPLPETKYPYNIFNVSKVLDKAIMIEEYTKQALAKGYVFYLNEWDKLELKETVTERTETEQVDLKDYFSEMQKEVTIDPSVAQIIMSRLK